VADEIGTSVRAVYSVFGSKEGLIRGLAERGFQLLMNEVDSAPLTPDPATDLAAAAIRGFRPFAIEHPDLFRLVFVWSGIDLGPDVGAAGNVAFSRLEARLENARAAGVLADRPFSELGLEFHALCQGLASVELCGVIAGAQADRFVGRLNRRPTHRMAGPGRDVAGIGGRWRIAGASEETELLSSGLEVDVRIAAVPISQWRSAQCR